jgi:hypothetical protein
MFKITMFKINMFKINMFKIYTSSVFSAAILAILAATPQPVSACSFHSSGSEEDKLSLSTSSLRGRDPSTVTSSEADSMDACHKLS